MDPFEQHFRRRIKVDAIVAFVVGVVAAYVIELALGTINNLLTVIIVVVAGGLWYKLRNVT
jgi:ABC-type maltose transport system permease subunit